MSSYNLLLPFNKVGRISSSITIFVHVHVCVVHQYGENQHRYINYKIKILPWLSTFWTTDKTLNFGVHKFMFSIYMLLITLSICWGIITTIFALFSRGKGPSQPFCCVLRWEGWGLIRGSWTRYGCRRVSEQTGWSVCLHFAPMVVHDGTMTLYYKTSSMQ